MKVKICGIRRVEDVSYINNFKPDYCGFILSQGYRRSVSKDDFLRLESLVDKSIGRVGVFVNENLDSVLFFADKLDIIQLHGDEDAEYVKKLHLKTTCEIWKAVQSKSVTDIENADWLGCTLLIDSFVKGQVGGTGETANFDIINNAKISNCYILAGGLDNSNVIDSIKAVSNRSPKPFCVDISSGVETDGFKDENKIKQIISTIKNGGNCNE